MGQAAKIKQALKTQAKAKKLKKALKVEKKAAKKKKRAKALAKDRAKSQKKPPPALSLKEKLVAAQKAYKENSHKALALLRRTSKSGKSRNLKQYRSLRKAVAAQHKYATTLRAKISERLKDKLTLQAGRTAQKRLATQRRVYQTALRQTQKSLRA